MPQIPGATSLNCVPGEVDALLDTFLAAQSNTAVAEGMPAEGSAGLTPSQLARVLPVVAAMRTEVMYGQYLDLTTTGRTRGDLDEVLKVIRFKTAKYTIERPLHIGARLAGADTALCRRLSAYALPLGEAFQLRDDLLAVFGDSRVTGKQTLDDLREGKATVLLRLTRRRADAAQGQVLDTWVGNPDLTWDKAEQIRSVIVQTGARAAVEKMINDRHQQALDAAARLPPEVQETLSSIAAVASQRSS